MVVCGRAVVGTRAEGLIWGGTAGGDNEAGQLTGGQQLIGYEDSVSNFGTEKKSDVRTNNTRKYNERAPWTFV